MRVRGVWLAVGSVVLIACSGCYVMRHSSGAGETSFRPPRKVDPFDVAVTSGFRIEPVAMGLTFPTGVTFDGDGNVYVVESGYAYGEVWTKPRLLRIEREGRVAEIAAGEKNGPWTGATFHNGAFYVAEGGEWEGGRILRITPDGKITALVSNLPSMGDHHSNGPFPRFLMKTQVRAGMGAMPSFHKIDIPPEELDALMKYIVAQRKHSGATPQR